MEQMNSEEVLMALLETSKEQQGELEKTIQKLENIRSDIQKDAKETIKTSLETVLSAGLSHYQSVTKKVLEDALKRSSEEIERTQEQKTRLKEISLEIESKETKLDKLKTYTLACIGTILLAIVAFTAYVLLWYYPSTDQIDRYHRFNDYMADAQKSCKKGTTCFTIDRDKNGKITFKDVQ